LFSNKDEVDDADCDLRSRLVNAKCTFHFISREQSVFFCFELFCLQVDISV